GYMRLLPGINSANRRDRGSAERQAANTPVQGSAADIMKKVQSEIYESIGKQEGVLAHGSVDMIAQIHDEIIFEIDDDPEIVVAAEKQIKQVMEQPPVPGFPVPIEAEGSVGYRWGEKMGVESWLKQR
ncbi:DNA polymerase, partial [Bacillus cereus group sp. Bce025]